MQVATLQTAAFRDGFLNSLWTQLELYYLVKVASWVLIADGINNFDLALFKNFNLSEQRKLQFRAELFNIANHANFCIPQRNLASSAFGRVSSTHPKQRQTNEGRQRGSERGEGSVAKTANGAVQQGAVSPGAGM